MLSDFEKKTRNLFSLKNRIVESPKTRILDRKCQFFLYLDLVKMRLEITLNNFEEEKKPFLTIKKLFQSCKIRIFAMG